MDGRRPKDSATESADLLRVKDLRSVAIPWLPSISSVLVFASYSSCKAASRLSSGECLAWTLEWASLTTRFMLDINAARNALELNISRSKVKEESKNSEFSVYKLFQVHRNSSSRGHSNEEVSSRTL